MTTRKEDAYRNVLEPLCPSEAELAFRDGLTGLYNYRLLEQLLGERWDELVALSDRFAMVILDLDLFKEVNDRYGHLSGDEVLRATGEILRRNFRSGDFIFRYGGDEFVVLLPGADAEKAWLLGERARTAMLEAEFFAPEEQERIEIPVSFSIGVAAYPAEGETGKAVLARADGKLYAEKQTLKRRIRRRRALIAGSAAAIVSAVALLVFLSLPGRAPEPLVSPPVAPATTIAAPEPGSSQEEQLLLTRIAELQDEIARLIRERKGQPEFDSDGRGQQIEALQSQVRELSERLEARSAGATAPVTDGSRPVSDRTGADRPLPEGEPRERADAAPPASSAQVPEPESVTAPRLLEPVIPSYPPMARDRRVEATIEFRLQIDESGHVVSATPLGPPKGLGFDEAARAAVLASKWSPGRRGGKPAPMETKLLVNFRIRG